MFLAAAVAALVCAGANLRAQVPAPNADGTNTAEFSGTVTDADGKPVAGATVEYWHYGENFVNPSLQGLPEMGKQTVISGTDGTFEFQVSSTIDRKSVV